MATAILLLLMSALSWMLGIGRYEYVVGALLLGPVVAYLLGVENTAPYLSLIVVILVGMAVARARIWHRPADRSLPQVIPLCVLLLAYVLFYNLSLLWADFVSIGERIRDYALLAAVIRQPLNPEEPWMAGIALNYYAYWYRVGHLLSAVTQIPVWETYHQLVSFTFALFFTSLFVLLHQVARFSRGGALLGAIVVSLGSNPQGVLNFFAADGNWWSASRVIEGAINEFPAWSFILGDAHPHYLNLTFVPFAIIVLNGLIRSFDSFGAKVCVGVLAAHTSLTWIYNGNAWETPIGLGLICAACGVTLLLYLRHRVTLGWVLEIKPEEYRKLLVFGVAAVLCCVSLYLSVSRIESPEGMDLTWVRDPIPRTPMHELLLHWGVALGMIAIGLTAQFTGSVRWLVGALLLVVVAVKSSWILLTALIVIALVVALRRIFEPHVKLTDLIWFVIGGTGLTFVLLPEFLFFNDSYGPEIERMNTIFKFYSASWFMVYIFGLWLLRESTAKLDGPWFRGSQIVAVLILCGFFYRTIDQRHIKDPTIRPIAQGLSDLDKKYPGAGRTIQELERLPRGIVLEAQGGAYSLHTHVATLSGNPAYLGWSNHVGLLARNQEERDEMARRQNMTTRIYTQAACDEVARLMQTEKILYLAVGPLERAAFPGIDPNRFSCLEVASQHGQYTVFAGRLKG